MIYDEVSIHASVKDATLRFAVFLNIQNRFNPRICKRCDFHPIFAHRQRAVSIHASVKDATQGDEDVPAFQLVSIHASVKDATRRNCFSPGDQPCFNPRICKRCDDIARFPIDRILVSIHASVKDATVCPAILTNPKQFQSTHL